MAFNGAFFLPLFWKSGVPWVGGVVGETTNIADGMILIDCQMSYDDLVEEVSKKCKVDPRVTQMSFTLVWSDGLDRRSYVFIDDKRFVCAIYMYAYYRPELYVSLEHNVFQSSEPVLPLYEFGGSSQPVRDEHNIRDPVSLNLNINHLDLNKYPVDLNETNEDNDDPTYMEDLDEIDIDEDSACSESSLEPSGSDSDDHVPIDHYVYGVGTGLSRRWDGNVDTITAGTVFKSKLEVQNALTVWSAKRGVSYCSVESNKKTWSVKCVTSKYPDELLHRVNCGWSMRATKQAVTGKWKIVKWAPQHNCAGATNASTRGATNASRRKNITSREIASLVMSKIKLDTGYKIKLVQDDVKQKFNVEVSYTKAWHGRRKAIEAVYGSWETNVRAPFWQSAPTKLDYYDNMWKVNSKAIFLSFLQSEDGRPALILDSTIFHPQGGGQPSDTGFVTVSDTAFKFVVQDVSYKDGIVYHCGHVENSEGGLEPEWKIEKGTRVQLHVDESRRNLNSRLHSAGHLLDISIVNVGLGHLAPGKANHFPDSSWVEYKGTFAQSELKTKQEELEKDVNALISRGGKVSAAVLPYEEAAELCGGQLPHYIPKDRSPRIVKLGENLGCPCGGTHVRDISEIRSIKVSQIRMKKGTTKVFYNIDV